MKDFAKSIHVGNSDTRSEYNAEIHRLEKKMEQLRSMGQGKQATDVEKQIEKLQKELRELGNSKVGNGLNPGEYTIKTSPKDPQGNYEVTVTLKSGEVKKFRGLEAVDEAYKWIRSQKTANSKVGNSTIKFYGEIIDLTKKSESDLKEILEELQALHEGSDEQRAIKEELKRRKVGNSKIGNADKYSGNYIIMSDDGDVWFRDEHDNVSIRNIDSWAQKRIAEYQRSINEIQKGVQEAKQAAKKFGLL